MKRRFLAPVLALVGATVATAWSAALAAENTGKASAPPPKPPIKQFASGPPTMKLRTLTKDWGGSLPDTAVGATTPGGYTCGFGAFIVGPKVRKATVVVRRTPEDYAGTIGTLLHEGPLTYYREFTDGTAYSITAGDGTKHYYFLGNVDYIGSPPGDEGFMVRWVGKYKAKPPAPGSDAQENLDWKMARYAEPLP